MLPGGADQWAPATTGVELRVGDALKVGDKGMAEVRCGGRARTKVNGGGIVRFGRRSVFLASGRAFAWVEKAGAAFSIGTRQATAAVRGTQFNVDVREMGTAVLSVVEGAVEFGNVRGRVKVKRGMQSQVKNSGEPSAPIYADLASAVSWAGVDVNALEFPVDVALRVRPDSPGGAAEEVDAAPPTLVVEIDYGKTPYASLVLYCVVTAPEGRTVAKFAETVCEKTYRYRVKKLALPAMEPGTYEAKCRIGHGDSAVVETATFAVK